MSDDKTLLQYRLPMAVHEVIKVEATRFGISKAEWLRRLVTEHYRRNCPELTIVRVHEGNVSIVRDDLRFEVTMRDMPSGVPVEGMVEGDDRSDQGWNLEPEEHYFLLGDSKVGQKVRWTVYDSRSQRLMARLEEASCTL